MSDPWLKFFPTDWRADPALRMCSPAARGVWIDMICLMHEATPYGHLLINGHCPTDAQLSVLLGLPPEQFSDIQSELEQAGVFSRTRTGVIYSRRMTRLAKKSATARKNGRKGGNPTLSNKTENPALDNPEVKGGVKTHMPEARSQREKEEPNGSSKKKSSNQNRGSRLPTDWQLPKAWGDWAMSEGLDDATTRREADKFRDWWCSVSGQKGVKLDWLATWRNWVRKAIDDRAAKSPKPKSNKSVDGGAFGPLREYADV